MTSLNVNPNKIMDAEKSDTPRTDAESYRYGLNSTHSNCPDSTVEVVKSDFARQLERELNEAIKKTSLEGFRSMGQQVADALDQRDSLRRQNERLREALLKVNEWYEGKHEYAVDFLQDIENQINKALAAQPEETK